MPKCGAKTRKGSPCQHSPVPGKKRCRLHGGMSTGPKDARGNRNAAKPGSLYSKFLSDEEIDLADSIELGKVDDELMLCRIRLRRVLQLEADSLDLPEFDEQINRTGGGPNTVDKETKYKRRDYFGLADRLMGRIESLERTRLELITKTPQGDEEVRPVKVTVTVIDASKSDAEP